MVFCQLAPYKVADACTAEGTQHFHNAAAQQRNANHKARRCIGHCHCVLTCRQTNADHCINNNDLSGIAVLIAECCGAILILGSYGILVIIS